MRIKRNISTIPGSTKKSGRLLSPRVSLVETVLLWRSKNAATCRRPHFLVLVAQRLAHPVQRPHASLVTPPNKLTPASPFHNMFHGLTGVEPGASHKDWECSCGVTGVPALELPTHKERIKKMVTINSDHTVTLLIGEVEALVAFHNYLAGFTTKGLDENTLRYGIQALSSLLIVRDMFLIDSFHGCTMQDFLDNVEHPFAEKTVHYVRSSLDLVFRDDNFTLDTRRIHRAIALLTTMLELKGLSQRETVTVYGTLSYLYWLKNDTTNARITAQKALTIDEKYWLARITTTALLHHITPHWCQK